MNTVKIVVLSYEEGIDVFTVGAFGFDESHVEQDPEYCRSAPDFDDFEIPGLLLPVLIGECGEPDELVGRTFEAKLP